MAHDPGALYPLRTEPVFRHYIWGGGRLGPLLGKPLGPEGTLAESWEIADEARVANGPLQGQTLRGVDEASGGALTGDAPRYPNARLPLLIKLSDAAADLSVQIHPDDEQALRDDPGRGYPGKTEMYLILDAEPGAGMYWGVRAGVTAADLGRACRAGQGVPDLLNFVPLRAGDVLYTPAGVVHAIGKGVVYCEVQQNSDITYRLYDWGRLDNEGKPRPLHIERGLAVLRTPTRTTPHLQPLTLPLDGDEPAPPPAHTARDMDGDRRPAEGKRTVLCASPHFAVELLSLYGPVGLRRARQAMRAIVVLEGQVTLSGDSAETASCGTGQSAVIPAALANPRVTPDDHARLLLTYIPDMRTDIVEPLRAAGHGTARIAAIGEIAGA